MGEHEVYVGLILYQNRQCAISENGEVFASKPSTHVKREPPYRLMIAQTNELKADGSVVDRDRRRYDRARTSSDGSTV
jgi:hypothetical protein